MTSPSDTPPPDTGPAQGRPGRKLGPIAHTVDSVHRAWLEPVRGAYLRSGLTLSQISEEMILAKSKLSELLRGTGLYPRWEIVCRLATTLKVPTWPLYRLWWQAAVEAHKTQEWIKRSSDYQSSVTATGRPPVDHQALQHLLKKNYRRYARVFLTNDEADIAVRAAFDILWLSWNEALASPGTNNFAWKKLRQSVMSRALHRDGHPELGHAAFDTVALHQLNAPQERERIAQMEESMRLFTHISRLPDRQLDVVVLRRLCGFTQEDTSHLLGVSLATVRSTERHATRQLESLICPPPNEGHVS